jgi:hypothetical protein
LGNLSKVPPGKHDANTVTADNADALLNFDNLNLGRHVGLPGASGGDAPVGRGRVASGH